MENLEQWDVLLETVTFATNNRVREAPGYSAYELMFGRNARLPIEAKASGESVDIDRVLSDQSAQSIKTSTSSLTDRRN